MVMFNMHELSSRPTRRLTLPSWNWKKTQLDLYDVCMENKRRVPQPVLVDPALRDGPAEEAEEPYEPESPLVTPQLWTASSMMRC